MSAEVINLSERRKQKRDRKIFESVDDCFKAQADLWRTMNKATIDMIPTPWELMFGKPDDR